MNVESDAGFPVENLVGEIQKQQPQRNPESGGKPKGQHSEVGIERVEELEELGDRPQPSGGHEQKKSLVYRAFSRLAVDH